MILSDAFLSHWVHSALIMKVILDHKERRKTLTGHFKAELYKIAVNLYILYENIPPQRPQV
jgi:hypothetical protein